MTVARLHDSAECYLKVTHLTPEEETVIRFTIWNYAWPKTCCQQLRWIIYRIVQAVKSLFSCSDWQKAKKVISERITSILVEEKLILKERSQLVAQFLYSKHAEGVLTLMLYAHEKKVRCSSHHKQRVKGFDRVNQARKQAKGYTVEEPDDLKQVVKKPDVVYTRREEVNGYIVEEPD